MSIELQPGLGVAFAAGVEVRVGDGARADVIKTLVQEGHLTIWRYVKS